MRDTHGRGSKSEVTCKVGIHNHVKLALVGGVLAMHKKRNDCLVGFEGEIATSLD